MYNSDVMAHVLAMSETGGLISVCAWCERLQIDGKWVQAPRGAFAVIDVPNTVSHSICPSCAAEHAATRKTP